MKAITPVQNTTVATQISLTLSYDNLVDTAYVNYKLLTDSGEVIKDSFLDGRVVVIDGADYQSWGANGEDVNEQIYDIVLNKLGLNPLTLRP